MQQDVKKYGFFSKVLTFISCLLALSHLFFLFAPTALAADIAYLAYSEGFWQVWVMDADGSRQRPVTDSPYDKNSVSWYPDGNTLLVNGNQGEVAKVDIDSGKEEFLTFPLSGFNDAVLSYDGQWIAFSLSTSGSIDDNNIWLVRPDGTGLRKATNLKWLQHEPRWSRDGRFVYFLSGKGDQSHDIWRVDINSGSLEQLTSGNLYHFDVSVSASGQLSFSNNQSGYYDIWMGEPGKKPRQLTNDEALDANPAWSPDGKDLVFESNRGGGLNIWRLNTENEKATPKPLTSQPVGARKPVWYYGQSPRR